MEVNKLVLNANGFPDVLAHIPQPPKELYIRGANLDELLQRPRVTVVGSRKISAYGRAVTAQLTAALARAGVVIISGLAIGTDSVAHRAALEAGGLTIAVLPCSVDRIYPANHEGLARDIVRQGGALVSEYPAGTQTYKNHFIARNRIASGLGDGLLITEAGEKSGTLHTADFALQQGKEVMAVPGNITSPTSRGTNNLIKAGATPVTDVADIFHALGLAEPTARPTPKGANQAEQLVLDLLGQGMADGEQLANASKLEVSAFNQTLTMLEITGKVRALGNNRWGLH